MMDETNQSLLETMYRLLSKAIDFSIDNKFFPDPIQRCSYVPLDDVPKFKQDCAKFFLDKAKKHHEDPAMSSFCLGKATTFMTSEQDLQRAQAWLLEGEVSHDGQLLPEVNGE